MGEERKETREEGLAPVPPQEELLIAIERYLAAGVRLGTRVSNAYLQRRGGFVFSVRPDGLRILNLRKIDERIRIAAKMIAMYDPERVVAYSAKPMALSLWRCSVSSLGVGQ